MPLRGGSIKRRQAGFFICLLLVAFLSGCATLPRAGCPQLPEQVTIAGTKYISTEAISYIFNLDYSWDPITKRIVLAKGGKEARMMVGSSTVLLGERVYTSDKDIALHQGQPVVPTSFVQRNLAYFFQEEYTPLAPVLPQISGLPIRNVVIDPGHGGKDPGAISRNGLQEKEVVLDIGRRLRNKLKGMGVNVTLTRENDSFVSLQQRAQLANAKNSDFFISIHANASRSRWVSGVEVFYLSESVDDDTRSSSAAQKYELNLKEEINGKNTAAIIWDLKYQENRRNSIDMAELVCCSLSRNLAQHNRGRKPARFFVLKGTNIPAILIEVGFLSNAQEERKLRDSFYREKIAQSIADGISQYNQNFSQRLVAGF